MVSLWVNLGFLVPKSFTAFGFSVVNCPADFFSRISRNIAFCVAASITYLTLSVSGDDAKPHEPLLYTRAETPMVVFLRF